MVSGSPMLSSFYIPVINCSCSNYASCQLLLLFEKSLICGSSVFCLHFAVLWPWQFVFEDILSDS